MSDMKTSIKHNMTKAEACACLEQAIGQAETHFRPLLHRTEWSADRDAVRLGGAGFEIDARVDDHAIHITGRVPLVARLFAMPLMLGLKQYAERALEDRSKKAPPGGKP